MAAETLTPLRRRTCDTMEVGANKQELRASPERQQGGTPFLQLLAERDSDGHCHEAPPSAQVMCPLQRELSPSTNSDGSEEAASRSPHDLQEPSMVAMSCLLVGGGMNGAVDLCAGVCMVDEFGNVLLNTLVKPTIPVTNYRSQTTGLSPGGLEEGIPFKKARKLVLEILGSLAASPKRGGPHKKRLLIGREIQHSLSCLMIEHPAELVRDLQKPTTSDGHDMARAISDCSGSFESVMEESLARTERLMRQFLESTRHGDSFL